MSGGRVAAFALLAAWCAASPARAQPAPAPPSPSSSVMSWPGGPTQAPARRTISLEDALRTAFAHQPNLRAARANTDAAVARVDEARAPLLPQATANMTYSRQTSNYVPSPGALPAGFGTTPNPPSFSTVPYWTTGMSANQLLWDFGGTYLHWKSVDATARSLRATERQAESDLAQTIRVAYFAATGAKALIGVARDTLANQDRHLEQVKGFVEVGTHPEIDLAQSRADRANARLTLIQALGTYESTKATLNQAMGVEQDTDYDVGDEGLPPIEGEDLTTDALMHEARDARPELRSLDEQVRSAELTVVAYRTDYGPTLGVSGNVSDRGPALDNLHWNWTAALTLQWQFLQGGLTIAQVKEARANLASAVAARDVEELQVRLDVEQARIGVHNAVGALTVANEVVDNARERLRLAEGRYQAGVGNIIELGDAQVALTTAAVQRVQATFTLATARAQLMHSLGRR